LTLRYCLAQPDLEAFTFAGVVEVALDVRVATKTVVCHAHEARKRFARPLPRTASRHALADAPRRAAPPAQLTLSAASVTLSDGTTLAAASITHDARDEAQTVTLAFPKALPAGAHATLRMAFAGTLNDKMAGFYRSAYTGPNGESRHMGVTQFEATDARRAFPCWDEPSLKATFQVALRVPADRTALSNMPPASSVLCSASGAADGGAAGAPGQLGGKGAPGWKDVRFEPTPVMSTYLVAWVVGEFDVVESATKEGVAVRVWTPPGLAEQGR
jgi:puromycin-sensitive aminopeptidase